MQNNHFQLTRVPRAAEACGSDKKKIQHIKMHIRKAKEEEYQVLTDISFKSKGYWRYPVEYFDIWKEELTITSEYIAKNKVFVVESEDLIVGYYSIINLSKAIKVSGIVIKKGFWLEHMFILPSYIGNSIGTNMVSHLRSECKDNNINQLSVLADPNAKEFYEKMGFKYVKEYPSTIPNRTTPLLKIEI